MKADKCKNKKCQRDLPKNYQHKYCEHCRNKYIVKFKDGLKTTAGVAGSIALLVLTKGKFDRKD